MQLFKDFPEISTEDWRKKIESDLKGADYEKKLVWKTDEGIPVQPYYRSEDIAALGYLDHSGSLKPLSGSPNGWVICQDIFPGRDSKEANQRIKLALKGGAQAIRIQLGKVSNPGMEMLKTLLDGIPLGETEVVFQGFLGADKIYDNYKGLASNLGIEASKLKGVLGADPLGKMLSTGIPVASFDTLGKMVKEAKISTPNIRVIDVNGTLMQEAGSTLTEELAFTLSMANEYMAILTNKGIEAADVASSMQFSMAAGSNYFMEIAKIRAARVLWSKICEAYGLQAENSKVHIHTTSSQWNMTLYDPHVNMLRGCTEAMSSILGGADYITILPYDYPYGASSAFSDRVARNAQIILRDEAYLDRVSDPAAGSYYIETLTDSLAEKAWDLFREIENLGGFTRAFEKGIVHERVNTSKNKKLERMASGKDTLLGTNAFPNVNELILEQYSEATQSEELDPTLSPIRPLRIASMFEELRLETEKSTNRPRVFLFKYGNPAWATARASFSGNFFACAGYEILEQPAFSTIEEGLAAVAKANPDLVVLCSADDVYPDIAETLSQAADLDAVLVVAGNPVEHIEQLQSFGIEHFIHVKTRLLDALGQFNKLLLNS